MKVKIITNKGDWSCAKTGKGFFIQRLIKALECKGVSVTGNHKDSADVELGIGKFITKPYKVGKRVVRIGPSHFDTGQKWAQLNKRKAEAVKNSDGVIYQSKWSQRVGRLYLGEGKVEQVILNGDRVFDGTATRHMPSTAIMSTRKWIPQKRLKGILKIFKNKFDRTNVNLMVFGECDKKLVRKFQSNRIKFQGSVPQETVQAALSHARFMIHPVWLDACPNSVVEALAHHCPVLCSNQGGMPELVDCTSGSVIKEDEWDYKPVNLQKPPPLDEDIWGLGIMKMFQTQKTRMDVEKINIENIADQYIDFFTGVING